MLILPNNTEFQLLCRGSLDIQYTGRKHPIPPNPFHRTAAQPAPVAPRDQQLQSTWGKSLDRMVSDQLLVPVMEDIVQAAMREAVPELIRESQQEIREELQQAAMDEASNIVQGMVEEGQDVPLELQAELHQVPRTAAPVIETISTPSVVAEESQTLTLTVGESQLQEPAQEEDTESTPSDFDPEHWTQGKVASPKTIKQQ